MKNFAIFIKDGLLLFQRTHLRTFK
jgi:hypothetical protein